MNNSPIDAARTAHHSGTAALERENNHIRIFGFSASLPWKKAAYDAAAGYKNRDSFSLARSPEHGLLVVVVLCEWNIVFVPFHSLQLLAVVMVPHDWNIVFVLFQSLPLLVVAMVQHGWHIVFAPFHSLPLVVVVGTALDD